MSHYVYIRDPADWSGCNASLKTHRCIRHRRARSPGPVDASIRSLRTGVRRPHEPAHPGGGGGIPPRRVRGSVFLHPEPRWCARQVCHRRRCDSISSTVTVPVCARRPTRIVHVRCGRRARRTIEPLDCTLLRRLVLVAPPGSNLQETFGRGVSKCSLATSRRLEWWRTVRPGVHRGPPVFVAGVLSGGAAHTGGHRAAESDDRRVVHGAGLDRNVPPPDGGAPGAPPIASETPLRAGADERHHAAWRSVRVPPCQR